MSNCRKIDYSTPGLQYAGINRQVARWRVALGGTPTEARVERWVRTELLYRRRTVRIHPGVSRVLKHLREKLGISHDFSVKILAGIYGLSQSAFHARFHRVDGSSSPAVCSVAAFAAGLLRLDGWRQCNRGCS